MMRGTKPGRKYHFRLPTMKTLFFWVLLILACCLAEAQEISTDDQILKSLSNAAGEIRCVFSRLGTFWLTFLKRIAPSVGDLFGSLFGNFPAAFKQLSMIAEAFINQDNEAYVEAVTNLPNVLLSTTIPATFENGKKLLINILEAWPEASKISRAVKCNH
ncbi:hypothetical protein CAEBREN_11802 [Caenorhabditis brenneri]|uniref:Uncharacterized protein n=1 Tax=Caenorhabditis brenneri TaxID=135651 RepID=G0MJ78_CAEBE|nr:hypothetical protein CAEBREN_11802 [Caenorhabditis brenneri]